MNRQHARLLRRIERDALNVDTPISQALRNCLILGGQTGSLELQQWAQRELEGYSGVAQSEFPAYRKIPAGLYVTTVVPQFGRVATFPDQKVNRYMLPEGMRGFLDEPAFVGHGVTELEENLRSAEPGSRFQMTPPGADELAVMIAQNMEGRGHVSVYWSIPPSAFRGLLDQIRNRLIQLVAHLQRSTPTGNTPVSPSQIGQIMRDIRIDGNDNSVSVNVGTQADPNPAPSRTARLGVFWTAMGAVGTIAGAIIAF
ncbi:AbiTii domain-containing protein, partial [Streptomyces sp. 24-1644]|uniref:AbiTii domain-containing protein n=1 Tax=Streptomyces sp. 24-1644 TaxID=3457315 RepID=UPI003FA6D2FF